MTDFSKYWDPKIHISNSASNASLKSWKSLRLAKNGDAYIIQKFRVKGLFAENLELHEFPFDIQARCIIFGLYNTFTWVYFKEKGTSRQRSGKGAIRKRFPLQKPRWEKTKLTIRYLYLETYRKPNEQIFSQ